MPLISRRWRLPAIILFVCLAALAVLSGPLFPFTPLPSDIAPGLVQLMAGLILTHHKEPVRCLN